MAAVRQQCRDYARRFPARHRAAARSREPRPRLHARARAREQRGARSDEARSEPTAVVIAAPPPEPTPSPPRRRPGPSPSPDPSPSPSPSPTPWRRPAPTPSPSSDPGSVTSGRRRPADARHSGPMGPAAVPPVDGGTPARPRRHCGCCRRFPSCASGRLTRPARRYAPHRARAALGAPDRHPLPRASCPARRLAPERLGHHGSTHWSAISRPGRASTSRSPQRAASASGRRSGSARRGRRPSGGTAAWLARWVEPRAMSDWLSRRDGALRRLLPPVVAFMVAFVVAPARPAGGLSARDRERCQSGSGHSAPTALRGVQPLPDLRRPNQARLRLRERTGAVRMASPQPSEPASRPVASPRRRRLRDDGVARCPPASAAGACRPAGRRSRRRPRAHRAPLPVKGVADRRRSRQRRPSTPRELRLVRMSAGRPHRGVGVPAACEAARLLYRRVAAGGPRSAWRCWGAVLAGVWADEHAARARPTPPAEAAAGQRRTDARLTVPASWRPAPLVP